MTYAAGAGRAPAEQAAGARGRARAGAATTLHRIARRSALAALLLGAGVAWGQEGPPPGGQPPPGVDPALEAAWAVTFPPAAAAVLVPPGAAVMPVVAAGEAPGRSALAAAALAGRLRARFPGVAFPLRVESTERGRDGDREVAARAQRVSRGSPPVDAVIVVRTFAPVPPRGEGVAIAVLDVAGRLVGSGSGVAGAPVGIVFAPGLPLAAPAPEAMAPYRPSPTPRSPEEAPHRRQLTLSEQFIGMEHPEATGAAGHLEPWLGSPRHPLGAATVYEALERPDLATKFRWRRAARVLLLAYGGASGLAAMLIFLFDVRSSTDVGCVRAARDGLCGEVGFVTVPPSPYWITTGSVLGATALAAIIGGSLIKLDPLSAPEARRLIERHNLYHLPGEERESSLRINLGPALYPGGAGLALSGAF